MWLPAGMARRPARHRQQRVSGCASTELKRAPLGALCCAKRTSKDVQPDVRSCMLESWLWRKSSTSTTAQLKCVMLAACSEPQGFLLLSGMGQG